MYRLLGHLASTFAIENNKKKCFMISLLFICAILIACGDLLMGYVDALNNESSHDNKKIEGELFK